MTTTIAWIISAPVALAALAYLALTMAAAVVRRLPDVDEL